MKPVMKIENVVLENEVEGDVFTLHLHNIGKTSEAFEKQWGSCDASHIDAVESESGEFYRPLDENIEELMKDLEQSRQEVKDGIMSYSLEEALSDETYVIYYDRIGKDGQIKDLNIKFPENFGWGLHSAEELKERAVRIFLENI